MSMFKQHLHIRPVYFRRFGSVKPKATLEMQAASVNCQFSEAECQGMMTDRMGLFIMSMNGGGRFFTKMLLAALGYCCNQETQSWLYWQPCT